MANLQVCGQEITLINDVVLGFVLGNSWKLIQITWSLATI